MSDGIPSEMVSRATDVYAGHITGYTMRDGGNTYTCRCGEQWSGELASRQAAEHRILKALETALLADPGEPLEIIAQHMAWASTREAEIFHEDYPEIGVNDFERAVEASMRFRPLPPENSVYRKAYDCLALSASREEGQL